MELKKNERLDLAKSCKIEMKAAGAAIVLAQRNTNEFLEMKEKYILEEKGGRALLETLSAFKLDSQQSKL